MVVAVPCPWTCGLTSTAGRPAGASDGQTQIAVSVMRRIRRRCVAIGRLLSNAVDVHSWLTEDLWTAQPTPLTTTTEARRRPPCTTLLRRYCLRRRATQAALDRNVLRAHRPCKPPAVRAISAVRELAD